MTRSPPVPVDYAVADTQGAIGYMFVKALRNEFGARGLERGRSSRGHPDAWSTATIPRSRSDQADRLVHGRGARQGARRRSSAGPWRGRRARLAARGALAAAASASWRRRSIEHCSRPGFVVDRLRRRRHPGRSRTPTATFAGVEAVIDKDLASACSRAHRRRPSAAPDRRRAGGARLRQARPALAGPHHRRARRDAHLADDQFDAGSMGPKIAAMVDFVDGGGRGG